MARLPLLGPCVTHFVGISGVERKRQDVAARYPRTHKDAGIFGYDEILAADQVTDGTSKTIAVIGSGELAGPWVSAGGATVRGGEDPDISTRSPVLAHAVATAPALQR